ncbi:MAG: hypothetical protein ABH811_01425 [archaeon]
MALEKINFRDFNLEEKKEIIKRLNNNYVILKSEKGFKLYSGDKELCFKLQGVLRYERVCKDKKAKFNIRDLSNFQEVLYFINYSDINTILPRPKVNIHSLKKFNVRRREKFDNFRDSVIPSNYGSMIHHIL